MDGEEGIPGWGGDMERWKTERQLPRAATIILLGVLKVTEEEENKEEDVEEEEEDGDDEEAEAEEAVGDDREGGTAGEVEGSVTNVCHGRVVGDAPTAGSASAARRKE